MHKGKSLMRIRYRSIAGVDDIYLEVPWPPFSNIIPPPTIQFGISGLKDTSEGSGYTYEYVGRDDEGSITD